ncbi:MAG TPA: hypothetical protein DEQ14_02540 [Treponema sp.]|nr:hypothetical protein [Treponema sp.]
MLDAGERAYAYSKACGVIGKSFVGKRLSALAGVRTLNELDRLIFPEPHTALPGREFLVDIENRIVKRAVNHILSVVRSFRKPPELLIRQLRAYEYADLKTCLHYLRAGKKELPKFVGIGNFGTVKFEFYPDLRRMLEGTEFDFILRDNLQNFEDENCDLTDIETEMDTRYYSALKESLFRLSAEDRIIAQRILSEEISLRNCIWALRLRSYFEKSSGETGKHLMDISIPVSSGDESKPARKSRISVSNKRAISLAAEAVESLDMPMDIREAWDGWRWEKFLNPEISGEMWTADPRYFQNAASKYLYTLALRSFHNMPFAVSAIFCFIKLKQFEEDILTSVTEGLGLGLSSSGVFELLEVPV